MITNQVNIRSRPPAPPSSDPSASGMARAVSSADPRFNMKRYDRAGVSRGRGQMHQAGISAAQNYQQGMSDVFDQQLQLQSQNAGAALGLDLEQEQFGQALGALNSQAAHAQQMGALQRQSALMGLLR